MPHEMTSGGREYPPGDHHVTRCAAVSYLDRVCTSTIFALSGNTLAGAGGASLRDLMDRMSHDSVRAATISQHATTKTSRLIADSIGGLPEPR